MSVIDVSDLEVLLDETPWTDDMHHQNVKEHMSSCTTKELLKRKNAQTPDFFELKARGDNFVFVYGTLRTGGSNFHLLEGSKYLGYAQTTSPNYILRRGRAFPMVKKSNLNYAGKVEGEVFAVDALTMCELDRLEGNNSFYTREEIFVTLDEQSYKLKDGKTGKPVVRAWIYLIPEDDTSLDDWFLGNSRKTKNLRGEDVRLYYFDQPKFETMMDS
jgi:gamma-glutamylcyclotransferase (GGCT)/AIG2-like uncharacterized protein YtfP